MNNTQVKEKQQEKVPQTEWLRVEEKVGSWQEEMETKLDSGGEQDKLRGAGRK